MTFTMGGTSLLVTDTARACTGAAAMVVQGGALQRGQGWRVERVRGLGQGQGQRLGLGQG